MLSTLDHSRDSAGLTYVYPVISRRAGGVSVGINLNTNNACNWACIYCQVPNLKRGAPPAVNASLLKKELTFLLDEIINGDFLQTNAPDGMRHLVDIAFSGNGEPTSSPNFIEVIQLTIDIFRHFNLDGKIPLRLITNGSLIHRPEVQAGIKLLGEIGGEVWFKIDRATENGIKAVNKTATTPDRMLMQLLQSCTLANTWVQSCFFRLDDKEPSEEEILAYLALIKQAAQKIKGVHLYGIARESMQQEAKRLSALSADSLGILAQRICELGVTTTVNP